MRAGSAIRSKFPALRARRGRPSPAYLDSACMSLVPDAVLEAMRAYYSEYPGCAGRSVYRWSEEVSERVERVRARWARFLGAPGGASSVVFLKNSTEGINLVAQGLGLGRGDGVVISDQEHNSNLVPWQRLATEVGVRLRTLSLPADAAFDLAEYGRALETRPKLVSLFHASNLDGRLLPVEEIVARAHDHGARVLLDGCQAAPHRRVDLARIGADFYVVSGHKMLGPTGTGVLVGVPEALAELRPSALGGETVEETTLTGHRLRPPPYRFEAGLQNYAGILGMGAALEFLEGFGSGEIESHDRALNERLGRAAADLPSLRRIGPPRVEDRPSVFAFSLDGIDPNDAALFLDEGYGVMVRSGRHCVHSWYDAHGLDGTVRASFYVYNTPEEVDRLAAGVRELVDRMRGGPARPTTRGAHRTRSGGRRRPPRALDKT